MIRFWDFKLAGAPPLLSWVVRQEGGRFMRISHWLPAMVFLAVGAAPASAADLAKIDRTISKEPAYKNKPKYCLVVFGTEAKTRIWLVQDGDVLYVDRNGNGDLTEKDELLRPDEPQDKIAREYGAEPGDHYRRWTVGEITSADGKTKYTRLQVDVCRDVWGIEVRTHHDLEYLPQGLDLQFADRPQDAPIV